MKTTFTGRHAESAVAERLKQQGHQILAANWRRPRCEIDLVSKKDGVVYFSEVKYRGSTRQGEGFDYLTATKLKQMNYAAEMWLGEHSWSGDWRLCAASVSGSDYQKIIWLEIT